MNVSSETSILILNSYSPSFPQRLAIVRCCGVLEVARIARAGFPTRYSHAAFVERYRVLLPPATQEQLRTQAAACMRGAVQQLLAAFKVDDAACQASEQLLHLVCCGAFMTGCLVIQ